MFRVIYRYPTYFNVEYVPEGIPEVRGEALTPGGFIERLVIERCVSPETSSMFPMTQGTMGGIGLTTADAGLPEKADVEVVAAAKSEGSILFTLDLEFVDLRPEKRRVENKHTFENGRSDDEDQH